MSRSSAPLYPEFAKILADYALSARAEAIVDKGHSIDALVNWVACAIGGGIRPAVDAAARGLSAMSAPGGSTGLAHAQPLSIADTIFLDCLSSCILAYNDTHLETILHPTGPIASALLGLSRLRPVSGAEFLTSLSVGMEVQCRLGLAIASAGAASKRGWFSTGLAAGVGVVAAIGRLEGFTADQMLSGFGLAAASGCGNRGTHASSGAAFVPAIAAENGFKAAMLAAAGYDCSPHALDGANGLVPLVANFPAWNRALRGLGETSEAALTAFKPYPGGIILHPAIDACLDLLHKHGVDPAQIATLIFSVADAAFELGNNKGPQDAFEASVSLYHWASVAIVTGRAGIDGVAPGAFADPHIRAFEERIQVESDSTLAPDQCRLVANLADGRQIDITIEHATGSIDKPMRSTDIDQKFRALVGMRRNSSQTEALLSLCRGVLDLADVSVLMN